MRRYDIGLACLTAATLIFACASNDCTANDAKNAAQPNRFVAREDFAIRDIQSQESESRWSFYNGAEFPGAKGFFEIADTPKKNKLTADYCGRIHFDFTDGGAYVCAKIRLQALPIDIVDVEKKTLQMEVFHPEGVRMTLRVTDSEGQTFQKALRSAGDRWTKVTTELNQWTLHWGGKNDGTFRGKATELCINVDKAGCLKGDLYFDNLTLFESVDITDKCTLAYPFERSVARQDWNIQTNPDHTRITFPARTLPGFPTHIKISALAKEKDADINTGKGRIHFHTHFMTFYKDVEVKNVNSQWVLETDTPPGNGWQYAGGENDGNIHGPLRLGTIELNGIPVIDPKSVQIEITTTAPQDAVLMHHVTCTNPTEDNDNITFTWNAQSMAASALKGNLVTTIRDWDGNVILEKTEEVSVPANYELYQKEISLPTPSDKNFLEATCYLEADNLQQIPERVTWLGNFPRNEVTALENPGKPEDASPFGMGIYLYRFSTEDQVKVAEMAARAGVKWTREEFNWGMLEPQKGQYNWAFFDNLVATAEHYGIQVYGILAYWTSWTKPYTDEGIEDYLRYVKATVSRYKGRIHHWEIWNEPNIFFWQGEKEQYAELLKRAYAVIKEIDPQIQVLGLSTAGIDFNFIERFKDMPFDILTIHPYRSILREDELITELKKASKLVDGKPIWNTEIGWTTCSEHPVISQDFVAHSERSQAENLVRTHLTTIVSGVHPVNFWYNFRNDGNDPWYFEFNMGITRQDFSPKPAYAAFSTMAHILSDMRFTQLEASPKDLPQNTYLATFAPKGKNGAKQVIVVWNALEDIEFTPSWDYTSVVNAVGESGKPTEKITLRKGSPLYFIQE